MYLYKNYQGLWGVQSLTVFEIVNILGTLYQRTLNIANTKYYREGSL